MKSYIFLFFLFVMSVAISQERLHKKYEKSLPRLNDFPLQDGITTKKKENYSKDGRVYKINKGFEKVINFVNVLGQLEDYIFDRTKNIIRKLGQLYNSGENKY